MSKRILWILSVACWLVACVPPVPARQDGQPTIVVTYSILGALVQELTGDQANVIVSMPNGQDPHEWEPSARDIEALTRADLIVQNGLGLEGGMEKALAQAAEAGVMLFTASDHITIRRVGEGEGLPTGDPDQAAGAQDPHLWTDPLALQSVVAALAEQIQADLGMDVSNRAAELVARLADLNMQIADSVNDIPESNRKLVTGHESMGYFADRYGFKLVGAVIPSISTQAEVSAADLAALKSLIEESQVRAIFAELGTPPAVTQTISQETGVKVVELTTHTLPEDGSYFTFMRRLAAVIVENLK